MTAIEKIGISIEAELDTSSFQKSSNQIIKYARDTKKALDPELFLKLELDVAKLQSQLASAKTILAQAKKSGDQDLVIKTQIDTNRLQVGLTEAKRQLNNFVNTGDKDLSRLQAKFNQVGNEIKNTGIGLKGLGDTVFGAAIIAGINGIAGSIIKVAASFQTYDSILTNALGSQEEARKSFEMLKEVSATTPFSLDQITQSYIKLVNRGFKPTIEEITKLGDLASSQGKSFDQLTEAVLDAQSGEFERLKEFGVRAKQSGDEVSFTFKGVTTTVEKTDEAIKGYLLSLGTLNGIQGAMAAQSATFNGAMSNLGDAITNTAATLGSVFLPVLTPIVKYISEIVSSIGGWIEGNKTLVGVLATLTFGLGLYVAIAPFVTAANFAIIASFLPIIGTLGLIVGGLVLVNEAYQSNFLGFKDFVDGVVFKGKVLYEFFKIVFGGIADVIGKFTKYLAGAIGNIKSQFSGLSVVKGVISNIFSNLFSIIKSQVAPILGLISSVVNAISKIPGISASIKQAKSNVLQQNAASLGIQSPEKYNPFGFSSTTSSSGITSPKISGGGGGGGVGKSKADIAREEALKAEEDQNKRIAKLKEDKFKMIEEKGKKAFDTLTSDIKKSTDEVTKLQDKLKGVADQLASVDQSIANRILTIEEQLRTAEGDKRLKLEEELALAKANIDAETLQLARDEAAKSETQKLLDKKLALENEMVEIQKKIDYELQAQKSLADAKAKLEEILTEKYKIELQKRESLLQQSVNRQIALISSIPSVGGSSGTRSTVNNTKNTTINANINNTADATSLFRKISQ